MNKITENARIVAKTLAKTLMFHFCLNCSDYHSAPPPLLLLLSLSECFERVDVCRR
jgi:hypothetical protein